MQINNLNMQMLPEFITNRAGKRVGIISHFMPDGDCIGAILGLGWWCRGMGVDAELYCQDVVPERFTFLHGAEDIKSVEEAPEKFDILFVLDAGNPDRLGARGKKLLDRATLVVNIDHHPGNTFYGDFNYVDPTAAATCEILASYLPVGSSEMDARHKLNCAISLYAGMSTDTGAFQYESVTGATLLIAAGLLDIFGSKHLARINQMLYKELPMSHFNMMKDLCARMQFEMDGLIVHYSVTAEDRERAGISPAAVGKAVSQLLMIQGVKIAAVFHETVDGGVTMSLREKGGKQYDLGELARRHSGGGHKLAAGGYTRDKNIDEYREEVLQDIRQMLEE